MGYGRLVGALSARIDGGANPRNWGYITQWNCHASHPRVEAGSILEFGKFRRELGLLHQVPDWVDSPSCQACRIAQAQYSKSWFDSILIALYSIHSLQHSSNSNSFRFRQFDFEQVIRSISFISSHSSKRMVIFIMLKQATDGARWTS